MNEHPSLVINSAVDESFRQALVRFFQSDILAHQRDGDLVLGMFDLLDQRIPFPEIGRTGLESKQSDNQLIQPFLPEHDRHLIDRLHILGRDDRPLLHVTKQGDLLLEVRRKIAIGATQQDVGLNTDLAQLVHGMLSGLGLQFPGRPDIRHQRQVHVQNVLAADVVGNLPDRLQKRQTFDVADRPANLDDRHVGALGHSQDGLLDLVGNVRHHLHGPAQVVAAPFLPDHRVIDPTGGVIVVSRQRQRGVAFVMTQVQVRLGPIVGHEHFPVLIGIHGAWINIDVGVQLEEGNLQPPAFQQIPDRSRGQSLPQGRDHPTGHENIFAHGHLHRESRGITPH